MRRLVVLFLFLFTNLAAAASGTVRVGVLKFGTVNWELDVIQHHGLAAEHGIELQVLPLGAKNAISVALQGGAVDIIVSDWIWVSRQRAERRNYTFFPYSMTVGAVFVRPDAGIDQLTDLAGKKLGIAGGPVDKSWLLLQAFARKNHGFDMKAQVEPTFAAPPLLNQLMLKGDLPAVLNFWHYGARLQAAGMRPLITVVDLVDGLGIGSRVPLLGWVFNEQWASDNTDTVIGFLKASYAAKRILEQSDDEWLRIQPLTKADDPVTLHALRDAYRAGIPKTFGPQELDAAREMFGILAREGGADLVGSATALSPGTFWESIRPQDLSGR